MSLVSLVLRKTVVKMLSGQTWAGSVLDQPLDPLAGFLRKAVHGGEEAVAPLICVYTPDSSAKADSVGKDIHAEPATLQMTFYIYVSPKVTLLPAREPRETDPPGPPMTEYLFEVDGQVSALTLDAISRQIDVAMNAGDNEVWRNIWHEFVLAIKSKRERSVLVEVERGVNIPCKEVTYEYMVDGDPDFGLQELFGGWAKFDAALRAGSDADVKLADMVSDLVLGEPMHSYQKFQADFGYSPGAFAASGENPLATKVDGTVPVLQDAEIEPFIMAVRPRPFVEPWPEGPWPDEEEGP